MPTTTVHIPDQLMVQIDRAAQKNKISRNRFFILACEKALKEEPAPWPDNFFETDLKNADLLALREAVAEMETTILNARKSSNPINL